MTSFHDGNQLYTTLLLLNLPRQIILLELTYASQRICEWLCHNAQLILLTDDQPWNRNNRCSQVVVNSIMRQSLANYLSSESNLLGTSSIASTVYQKNFNCLVRTGQVYSWASLLVGVVSLFPTISEFPCGATSSILSVKLLRPSRPRCV